MKKKSLVLLGSSVLFSVSHAMAGPPPPPDMRDLQYCHIVIVTDNSSNNGARKYPAFTTTGYGNCGNWKVLKANDIIANYNAQFPTGGTAIAVELNYPRHWVMDSAQQTTPGTDAILFSDGIALGFGGYHTGRIPAPYVPMNVARTTVWTYNKGSWVYELIDPNGNTYVMQSYAQTIDKHLTIRKLRFLKPRLKLPAGWHYHARKLTSQLDLGVNGTATLVMDVLRNTYQLNPNP